MKNLKILVLIIFALILSNCKKNDSPSPIPYDKYIDCTISSNSGIIADSLNTTVQIDLKNHSNLDLSLKYLHIQLNLIDTISNKFYGCSVLEFKSNNNDTYNMENNSTVNISKNINEIIWNSFYKTSDLPAGKYIMTVNVSTGDLDKGGNEIFSNVVRISKL